MRKVVVILFIAIVGLVAACQRYEKRSGMGTDRGPEQSVVLKNAGVAADQEALLVQSAHPPGRHPGALPAPTPKATDRMIIRTANVRLVVRDTQQVISRLSSIVEKNGGYVSDSRLAVEGELLRATLTVRVPAQQLTATIAAARELAVRLEGETINTQEVTEEFVDLQARLRTLQATEAELRELLRIVREKTRRASDVLEIHAQLMSIRGEIEQTMGRMRYLETMTSFSTLTLELIPDAIAKPVIEAGWQPLVVIKDAGRALIVLGQRAIDVAIWAIVFFLPIVLLGVIGVLIVRRIVLRIRREVQA